MNSEKKTISLWIVALRCVIVTFIAIVLGFTIIHWIWSLDALPRLLNNQSAFGLNFIRSPGDTSMMMGDISEIGTIRKSGELTIGSLSDSSCLVTISGMQVGDKITMINGVSLKTQPEVFYKVFSEEAHGQRLEIGFIRDEIFRRIEVAFSIPESLQTIITEGSFKFSVGKVQGVYTFANFRAITEGAYLFLAILLLVVGCVVGYLKPGNSVAFQISIFFLLIGCFINYQFHLFHLFAILPNGILIVIYFAFAFADGLIIPIGLRILTLFPNPTKLGKLFLRFLWVILTLFTISAVNTYLHELGKMTQFEASWLDSNILNWFGDTVMTFFWIIGPLLCLVLLIAQRFETRKKKELRLRLIEASIIIGLMGLAICAAVLLFFSATNVRLPQNVANLIVVLWIFTPALSLSTIPIAVSYTIITRKIFDIRFIIRKGLQHLFLSKGALVIEGAIVFLIVQQIITHGGSTLANSPTMVSGLSLSVGIIGMLALNKVNRRVMPAIDRRFFREALDIKRLLMDLNEKLSEMKEGEKILQQTASTVLKALHPARVVMLLKDGKSTEFKCVLAIENEERKSQPSRHSELYSESEQCNAKTLKQVQGDGQGCYFLKANDPIIKQIEEKKGWAIVYPEKLDLEKEEDQRLSAVNCELLIVIKGSSGLVGIIGLGGKLSEEPYSKEDRELLMTVAREMGLALENAELLEVAKREAEYSKELDIARQVQQNLFPTKLPTPSGWEFAGICKPAKAVGGDYYDIFEAVPGKVVVALGDVSGKGLGASFVMSGVHSTIRTQAKLFIDDPIKIINELNGYLIGSTSKNIFVTLFLGIIDLETGQLSYVNCGHPPAFVVRKESGEIEKLTRTGLALGMMSTIKFTQGSSTLHAGDSLIVYSDGVTEAMNEKEEMFEEERLTKAINAQSNLDASSLINVILKSVDEFIGQTEQSDDVSIIVARRKLWA